jgi:hypothetical protein
MPLAHELDDFAELPRQRRQRQTTSVPYSATGDLGRWLVHRDPAICVVMSRSFLREER